MHFEDAQDLPECDLGNRPSPFPGQFLPACGLGPGRVCLSCVCYSGTEGWWPWPQSHPVCASQGWGRQHCTPWPLSLPMWFRQAAQGPLPCLSWLWDRLGRGQPMHTLPGKQAHGASLLSWLCRQAELTATHSAPCSTQAPCPALLR